MAIDCRPSRRPAGDLSKPWSVAPESWTCAAAIPSAQVRSSRDVGWTSLLIDHHIGFVSAEPYLSKATPDFAMGVATSGRYVSEMHYDGRWRRGIYEPGAICLHRSGDTRRVRFETRKAVQPKTAMVYIPRGALLSAAEHLRRPGQRTPFTIGSGTDRDPALAHMTFALIRAMEVGADDLHAGAAAAWLAVHLVTRHGATPGGGIGGAETVSDMRLARAIEYMTTHFAEPITLDRLAAEACISKFHFARVFRAKVGQTPHAYLAGIRLEAARGMLVTSDRQVAEVAKACGYPTAPHFSAAFASRFGMTPMTFRARRKAR